MSNAVFPVLVGVDVVVTKTPEWSTTIQRSVSGKELRAANYSSPIWHFSMSFNVLRAGAEAELQTLMGFFNARQGAFDSFLFSDPTDCSVVNQVFGAPNGSNTHFQLVRTMGGFTESIKDIDGTPVIKINGTQTTGFSFDAASGIVTFYSPPTSGAVLSWTGSFFFRVRFKQDTAEFEKFLYRLWQMKKCELVSVK